MTTSTAPITLPARHRHDEPIWAFHFAVAWVAWLAALAGFHAAGARIRLDQLDERIAAAPAIRHVAVITVAIAVIAAALAVLVGQL